MPDVTIILLVGLGAGLAAVLLAARRYRREVEILKGEIDALEGHNRMLADERTTLGERLAIGKRDLDETRKQVAALESDNATLESTKSSLEIAQKQLQAEKATLQSEHEWLQARCQTLESEKEAMVATAARLEKTRADLERTLAELRSRHADLETRVLGFQGEWGRQMRTLEEEIGTLMRQLGEFRKGTVLPLSAEPTSEGDS